MIKKIIKKIAPAALIRTYASARSTIINWCKHRAKIQKIKKDFALKAELLGDHGRFTCSRENLYPCVDDATSQTDFNFHYTYHPAWAARILAQNPPKLHHDIGSSLRFITVISAFFPVKFYDYRPAVLSLSNMTSEHADITCLPFADGSIESLSCMHVVEHIGLERYGDKFDPQGDTKAINELIRVIRPGGQLLFVVPVGGEAAIHYNAHRVYTHQQILDFFGKSLELKDFTFIDDAGRYIINARTEDTLGSTFGCGCYFWVKTNNN